MCVRVDERNVSLLHFFRLLNESRLLQTTGWLHRRYFLFIVFGNVAKSISSTCMKPWHTINWVGNSILHIFSKVLDIQTTHIITFVVWSISCMLDSFPYVTSGGALLFCVCNPKSVELKTFDFRFEWTSHRRLHVSSTSTPITFCDRHLNYYHQSFPCGTFSSFADGRVCVSFWNVFCLIRF